MLKLTDITKKYVTGDSEVEALKGVSITFRENEFVSILGQSGCGKTTLLNIIGGLDRYTDGDLVIGGKSTKDFKNRDWDSYRNHKVGFVFQSYNLISHQSVLSNVELALTLSGVSKKERRRRAIEVLNQVGLGDQLKKRPNQMSGGQMQRVAIARALINNPDILLADEPTGALDSQTSVQVMEILKEVAKDRLVIMVTHNPELAEKYSTRIIRLLDGKVVDDSDPFDGEENQASLTAKEKKSAKKAERKKSMSMWTALALSFNNLRTKKTRTLLTSFAGSIGIIGIALILSLSSGAQAYIKAQEESTLTNYPLTIQKESVDLSEMMNAMIGSVSGDAEPTEGKITSVNMMGDLINTALTKVKSNNIKDFKRYLDKKSNELDDYTTDIRYTYDTQMNIYKADTTDGVYRVNPSDVMSRVGIDAMSDVPSMSPMASMVNTDVFYRVGDSEDCLKLQFDLIAGKYPKNANEVVMIVDKQNRVADYCLYSLGILDADKLDDVEKMYEEGKELDSEIQEYSYDDILDLKFKILLNTDYYEKKDGIWLDKSEDEIYLKNKVDNATEIKVVGILRPNEDSSDFTGGMIGYTGGLMEELIKGIDDSEIVKEQKDNPDTDIFTGIKFPTDEDKEEKTYTMDDVKAYIAELPLEDQQTSMAAVAQMQSQGMTDEQIAAMFAESMKGESTEATYEGNLERLGVADLDDPSGVEIYPVDFNAKDNIEQIIKDYNDGVEEEDRISYTDYVGMMMSAVTTIINAISYILIAFVGISLVVSSIMIGIITYISVLERTKEIGILRAIGASKKDISRVFNAETLIVGLTSGLIGIGVTLLLLIPTNIIIELVADVKNLASLPTEGAIILVIISMLLTLIAGVIPSRIAAKKDPVEALRTE